MREVLDLTVAYSAWIGASADVSFITVSMICYKKLLVSQTHFLKSSVTFNLTAQSIVLKTPLNVFCCSCSLLDA